MILIGEFISVVKRIWHVMGLLLRNFESQRISENGGAENILSLENIFRLEYVTAENILSSPILGL
jgi:hypothetical protein